ncbi:MAG: hypothetical protein K6B64_05120 [Acholeplasmatales bacterium]|nr:hypothetical protein [Acholeplasmatales bacterium]
MNYLLYNPLANNGKGDEAKKKALKDIGSQFPGMDDVDYSDIIFEDIAKLLQPGDNVVILGGDGTLNFLVNDLKNIPTPSDISYYLYPAGTENDFVKDIQDKGLNTKLVPLNNYIFNVPKVKFGNKEMYFFNAVGFGVDGKTYAEAETLKSRGKKINYNSITSSLLKKYEKTNATVTVDGETKEFKEVYIAPTMNARYYTDGMKAAPEQNRLSGELSLVIIHDQVKGHGAKALSSIFKGAHTKFPEACEIIKGKHIKVVFDKPTALHVDGELFEDITSYEAFYE